MEESDRIAKSTRFGNKALLDGSGEELQYHVGPFAEEKENTITYKIKADATTSALGIDSVDISDKSGALATLGAVDAALVKMGEMRADFGAVQSRLQMTTSNLDIQYENLSAAKSRISDADVAFESAEMASAQILQNAAIGVLAQANQNGANSLRLLS